MKKLLATLLFISTTVNAQTSFYEWLSNHPDIPKEEVDSHYSEYCNQAYKDLDGIYQLAKMTKTPDAFSKQLHSTEFKMNMVASFMHSLKMSAEEAKQATKMVLRIADEAKSLIFTYNGVLLPKAQFKQLWDYQCMNGLQDKILFEYVDTEDQGL